MPHVDVELEDNKQFISNIPRILDQKLFIVKCYGLYIYPVPEGNQDFFLISTQKHVVDTH